MAARGEAGPLQPEGEPMGEDDDGFSIEIRRSGAFVLPQGVVAALEQLEIALVDMEAEAAEVSGFAFEPKLRVGELMPKLTTPDGGLSVKCSGTYSVDPWGTPKCKTTYSA